MSYNIMSKNASFKGDISGTIENQVNDWDDQAINGTKTFNNTINSSADVMLSGSGKVSASFFYGDGTGLTNVGGTISSYTNHATNRLIAGGASSTDIKGVSEITFTGDKLGVTGQVSASLGITGSEFHGSGAELTNLDADNISAGSLSAARLNLAAAGGLENNSNSLQINLSGSNSGLSLDSDGLQLDVFTLALQPSYAQSDSVVVQSGANSPKKIPFSTIASGIAVQAANVSSTGGRLANSTMPENINVTSLTVDSVTASLHVSASAFHGDGSALKNVSTAPAGADTQVQFNDGGTQAGNSSFTFGKTTGVMTVTTGSFSKISSSLIPNANNSHALGDMSNNLRWSNVASVDGNFTGLVVSATGAVTHRLGVGTLSPQNELEVTGNVEIIGDLSASSGITGSAFYGSGTTLTGVPFTSGPSTSNIVFVADGGAQTLNTSDNLQWTGTTLKATNLSASSDLQVGGHISGSGDLRLLNDGNIRLGGDSQITFDDGVGNTSGILQGGTNQLTIEAHNTLTIKNDNYFIIKDENGDNRVVADVRQAQTPNNSKLTLTDLTLSSSHPISASALHTNGGITAPGGGGGDFTFLDTNGNVTAGEITMVDDSGVLNFGNNSISGSGNISGSAFFGDGSNLENVQATPQFRYYTYLGYANVGTGAQWIYSRTNQTANANPASSIFLKWIAPGSGSLVRWVITPGTTTSNAQNSGFVTTSFLKNDITQNAATQTRTAHVTGSFDLTRTVNGTDVKAAVVDWTGTHLTVSGSNSFDPGDTLLFGIQAENAKDDCIISIVFQIDESIDYP